MNIEGMTLEQLNALIAEAQEKIVEIQSQAAQTETSLYAQVQDAISTLETLRGPDNPEPPSMDDLIAGNVSITEVRTFSQADMQAHAGLAIDLILRGLQLLTETTTAIARVQTRTLT